MQGISRFPARNTNMFIFSERRQDRFSLAMHPATLNALSAGTEVAGTQRYFLAMYDNAGKSFSFCCHQFKGFPIATLRKGNYAFLFFTSAFLLSDVNKTSSSLFGELTTSSNSDISPFCRWHSRTLRI